MAEPETDSFIFAATPTRVFEIAANIKENDIIPCRRNILMNLTNNCIYKKNSSASSTWTAAAVLFVCVMLTASIVGGTMKLFTSAREPDAVISVVSPQEDAPQNVDSSANTSSTSGTASANNLSPSFFVSDDKQVWGSKTKVDIFRASYENGEGVIVAAGKKGDKVVAPGTANSYVFHLTNDGNVALNYKMKITTTLSDNLKEYNVPVKVRLYDESGAWLCGGADKWKNFTALGDVSKTAVLGADSYSSYTVEWEWPFEFGDDSFDTLLGNLSADEDLVLTVNIEVTAEYNPNPEAIGGNPNMGYEEHTELWILIMLLSAGGFFIALIFGKRSKKRSEV